MGGIDVYVMKEKEEDQALPAVLNEQTVRAYLQAAEQLETQYGLQGKPSIVDMLGLPDVMVHSDGTSSIPEEQKDEWERVLQEGLKEALSQP